MQTDRKFLMIWGAVGIVAFLLGLGIAGLVWGIKKDRVYETKVYENKELHLKFSYTDLYFLTENTTATTSSIFLLNDNRENRDVASFGQINLDNVSSSMSVEIFERDNIVDIAEWVKKNAQKSHFDLSNQTFETATVGDKKIISYNWFGKSNGNTLALINQGKVYLFTVTFTSDSDRINKDFVSLISTLELI